MDNGNVGSRLQSARKARNWTIEEAAKRTKIKKDALQKLETNSFDDLPSVAYARGFVRIYAKELGLDPWSLLRDFDGNTDEELDLSELHAEDLEAIPKRKQPNKVSPVGIGLLMFLTAGLFIAVILGFYLYRIWPELFPEAKQSPLIELAQTLTLSEDDLIGEAPVEDKVLKAQPVEVPKAAPAVPMVKPAAPAFISHSLRLSIANGIEKKRRWVRVEGMSNERKHTIFEGHIDEGAVIPPLDYAPWAAEAFIVTMRDASVVNIWLNEENQGSYPKAEPKRLRLPKEL